eukprot:3461630-Amphidinium_carterae.1
MKEPEKARAAGGCNGPQHSEGWVRSLFGPDESLMPRTKVIIDCLGRLERSSMSRLRVVIRPGTDPSHSLTLVGFR